MLIRLLQKTLEIAECSEKRLSKYFLFPLHLLLRVLERTRTMQGFLMRGVIKNTDHSLTILFIGPRNVAYQLAHLVYHSFEEVLCFNKILCSKIDSITLPNLGIVAVCENRMVEKCLEAGYLYLPYVCFTLNLNNGKETMSKRLSKRRIRDLMKIKNANYSYIISRNDKRDFDFFYWEMYLPSIQNRFQKAAVIDRYSVLKDYYQKNGGLLFVRSGEMVISGILFHMTDETLFALRSGVYKGDVKFFKNLASQAALFFLIEWSKNRGLKKFDCGYSLPFFSDGIFNYKKEWGMFVEYKNKLFCLLKIINLTKGGLSLLQQNPFIFSENGVMNAVFLLNYSPTKQKLQKIFSKCFIPTLNSIIVVTYQNSGQTVINESSFSTKIKNLTEITLEPILNICSSLQKSGFKIDLYVLQPHRKLDDLVKHHISNH